MTTREASQLDPGGSTAPTGGLGSGDDALYAQGLAELPVRDVHLEEGFETVPKYFAAGDIAQSHLFAMLSATIPEGEDYFIRSVTAVRDQITDPELLGEIDAFIGQEHMHGREHRALNQHLADFGYPTITVARLTVAAYRLFERIEAPRFHLALTAAVEHYTATLAELLMTSAEARAVFEHEAVQELWVWHSLEESEHKAVAFDAFIEMGGGEFLRRFAMTLAHLDFIGNLIVTTAASIGLDRDARRRPVRTLRSVVGLARSPFASMGAAKMLAQYYRRGFHPKDRDTSELIASWRTELFA